MKIKNLIGIMLFILLIISGNKQISAQMPNIVNSNQTYTYKVMTKDLINLSKSYPDIIELREIGKSEYGRSIWAVKLGKGEACVFLNGSHHGREWLTTTLLVKMIEEYALAYTDNKNIEGYDISELLNKTSIWFVPMVNPDGVTIQQGYLNLFPKLVQKQLISINKGSKNFKEWKADARGIDLNRQYPARWEDISNNVKKPSKCNYKGTKPLMTRENKALVDFTKEIKPEISVAYHSAGRLVYWYFYNIPENIGRDKRIAEDISKITGYSLEKPAAYVLGGGYKDWFIQEYGRPAYTIEIGKYSGNTNLPVSDFDEEWRCNKNIGAYIASEGYKLWNSRNLTNSGSFTEEQENEDEALSKRDIKGLFKYSSLNL